LHTEASGHIAGYGLNGWIAAGMAVLTVLWVGQVRGAAVRAAPEQKAA
jgi:hypothetical protein